MNFRKTNPFPVLISLLIILSLLLLKPQSATSQQKKFSFSEQKMGSAFTIIFFDSDTLHAVTIAEKAFKIVDSLNLSFSDYLESSEISKIASLAGNGEWLEVTDDLFAILKESKYAYEKSSGAFDITIGQLTKLWRKAKKEKRLPNDKIINRALVTSGMKYLALDTLAKKVKLLKKGASIDLGGIGKGYAAQKVFDFLQKNNFRRIIVDAAGNMAIGEPPTDNESWKIAIDTPERNYLINNKMLMLNNLAISTSGDANQFVEIYGKRYSHILNPKTGLGLQYQRQVTVVCTNAAKADWLSTALTVLPIKKGLILAKKEKAEVLIFEKKGNSFKEILSDGFAKFYQK
ncbi:MAG: FAD:protein FMN transferase [Bacteroidota bacterium]